MRKLNICLISLTIPPDRQDGAAKFFKGIYEYLKDQGHKVTLLTAKWDKEINDPNIYQIKIIKKRFLWLPHFLIGVFKYLRAHEFDIIHGNASKGALPIILSNKKKFIATIHDLGPFETRFTLIPIEKNLIKLAVKKATNITTCSGSIKKQIKYYIPEVNAEKIFNLYSAIEDKFKPYPEEAKYLKSKLNIEGPILLYLGRIAQYKGVDDIIKAYEIAKKVIPNLNLVIGGKPDFSSQKNYQIWKNKYQEIKFIGFVSPEEIPIYYTMADIFITYSYASEGFGLTPIEAIACGTPVICSSIPAYKEVLKDNAVFVPPRKPKLLAEDIIKLLKNDNLRKNLTLKAKEFIKRYSWEEVGKKLEKLYNNFLYE